MLRPLRLYHAFAVDVFLSPLWLIYLPSFFASFLFFFSLEYESFSLPTQILLSLLGLVGLFMVLIGHNILKARLLDYYGLDFLSLVITPFGDKLVTPPQNLSLPPEAIMTPRAVFFIHLLTFIYYFFCIIALTFMAFVFDAYTQNILINSFLNLLTLTTVFLFVINLIPCLPFAGGYIILSFVLKLLPRKNIILPFFTNAYLIIAAFIFALALFFILTQKIPFIAMLWVLLSGFFILNARHHFKNLLAFFPLQTIDIRRTLAPAQLKKDWHILSTSQTLTEVADLIHRHRLPLYPVLDRDLCLGVIIPDYLFTIEREAWPLSHVSTVMKPLDTLVLVTLTEQLDDIRNKIIASPYDWALVMGEDRESLLGYITLKDL